MIEENVFWNWLIAGLGGVLNIAERVAIEGRKPDDVRGEQLEELVERWQKLLEVYRWRSSDQ